MRGAWIEIPDTGSVLPETRRSLPVRGAWIEILLCACVCLVIASLPVRGAWIEIALAPSDREEVMSLPVRGAWIEIAIRAAIKGGCIVAPRAGSVD